MPALSPQALTHLTRLFDVECAAIAAYDRALPHVDTPELAAMLCEVRDDHVKRVRQLAKDLEVREPEVKRPALSTEASVGDTSQTLKALEEIHRFETTTVKTWREIIDSPATEKSLKAMLTSQMGAENADFEKVERVLKSVRAVASTWGPPDQPWILHH